MEDLNSILHKVHRRTKCYTSNQNQERHKRVTISLQNSKYKNKERKSELKRGKNAFHFSVNQSANMAVISDHASA
jgi:hypothetical protein